MKSENAIGIAEAMYAMYEGLYSSLQGAVQVSRWWWGPSTGLQCHIEGPTTVQNLRVVSSTTRGPRVVLKGLYRLSGCR